MLLLARLAHIAGFSLWIAGLIAMATLLIAGSRNKAAGILADIGATLAILSGVYRAIDGHLFAVPWMHVKLTLVAIFIVLHVLLRIRMKRGTAGGAGLLGAVILLAILIQGVLVYRPFER